MASATTTGDTGEATGAGGGNWPSLREGDLVLKEFRFASAEILPQLSLHYRTLGVAHRDHTGAIDNAVLLLHSTLGSGKSWLTPSLGNELFGEGRPLDAARHFIILPDAIGHGHSSKPSDGLRGNFPRYRYGDMIEAQRRLVTEGLGVQHLRLVLGVSMGAAHAWMWGYTFPEMMDAVVPIAAEPVAPGGRNWLIRRIIIEAIRNDPDWLGGFYDQNPAYQAYVAPLLALMALNPAQLHERAGTVSRADALYAEMVQDARQQDANDVLYALEALLDFEPAAHLDRIKAQILAINFADDQLLSPRADVIDRELRRIPGAKHYLFAARGHGLGHYSYMASGLWSPILAELLANLPRRS